MIHLVIADPDPAISKAICLLLQREMPPMQITEIHDVAGLIRALSNISPDILLLDCNLYGSPATDMYRLLQKAHPHLKVILMGADAKHESDAIAVSAPFLNKCIRPEEWLSALQALILPR